MNLIQNVCKLASNNDVYLVFAYYVINLPLTSRNDCKSSHQQTINNAYVLNNCQFHLCSLPPFINWISSLYLICKFLLHSANNTRAHPPSVHSPARSSYNSSSLTTLHTMPDDAILNGILCAKPLSQYDESQSAHRSSGHKFLRACFAIGRPSRRSAAYYLNDIIMNSYFQLSSARELH